MFKHFRDNIRKYNLVLVFTSLKYILDIKLQAGGIQNFQIHRKLYYILRNINVELYDNNTSHYAQLYIYDPIFATEQCITRNLQLKPDLLHQLIKVLHSYNPFIIIYKTRTEQIQFLIINTTKKMQLIFNPQMKFFLELEANQWYSN